MKFYRMEKKVIDVLVFFLVILFVSCVSYRPCGRAYSVESVEILPADILRFYFFNLSAKSVIRITFSYSIVDEENSAIVSASDTAEVAVQIDPETFIIVAVPLNMQDSDDESTLYADRVDILKIEYDDGTILCP